VAKDRPKPPKAPKPPKPLRVPEPEPLPATAAVERPAVQTVSSRASRLDDLVRLVGRSRLTYGEPVQSGARTVIPVSRVRLSGGLGWGRGGGPSTDSDDGSGAGGGGHLDAQPVGFIDMGPDGSRFVEIPDPDRMARNVKAGAAALTAVLTGLAGRAPPAAAAAGRRAGSCARGARTTKAPPGRGLRSSGDEAV
jgi:uncharacterized spore protein YtfJ